MEPLNHMKKLGDEDKALRELRNKITSPDTKKHPELIPQLKVVLRHLQAICPHNKVASIPMKGTGRMKELRFCFFCGTEDVSPFKTLKAVTIKSSSARRHIFSNMF